MPLRTFVLLIVLFACGFAFRAPADPRPEDAAQAAAERWLAIVDTGRYAESWSSAAPFLQATVPPSEWTKALNNFRKPLGPLFSRTLKSARYAKNLPGAPDGEYVVLQFNASFGNKRNAVETITPMLGRDGVWKVSGYYIK